MAYVALNINVYSAAFAGAMAALCNPAGAALIDPTTGDYAPAASVAAAYAQAIDTQWGAGVFANQYDLDCLKFCSMQYHSSHPILLSAPGTALAVLATQANWTTTATAIVAAVKQGDTNYGTQNLTAPGVVGSNRAYGQGSPTTPAAATITPVGCAKLIAKTSGLFHAWCSASQSVAAADVATFTVKTFTDAVAGTPLTIGNVAQVGFGSNGVAQPGNVAVANNGAFLSTAGAGVTVTGGNAGFTFDSKSQTQGTAATGTFFEWDAIAGVQVWQSGTPTNEQIIPLGQTFLVTFSVTNSVAARAIPDVVIGAFEMP